MPPGISPNDLPRPHTFASNYARAEQRLFPVVTKATNVFIVYDNMSRESMVDDGFGVMVEIMRVKKYEH